MKKIFWLIPFVVLVGEEEMEQEIYKLKNMLTGEQSTCNLEGLLRLNES